MPPTDPPTCPWTIIFLPQEEQRHSKLNRFFIIHLLTEKSFTISDFRYTIIIDKPIHSDDIFKIPLHI